MHRSLTDTRLPSSLLLFIWMSSHSNPRATQRSGHNWSGADPGIWVFMQTPDMQPEEGSPARPGQARSPESLFLALTTRPVQEGKGTVHCSRQGNPGPISVTAAAERREDSPGKTSY